ncbi:MAG: DNA alkylation repair protein [Anaerolineaceae bacterium]|nr:DNA alkylation repair protein [Anaerolineaceae bacterium]
MVSQTKITSKKAIQPTLEKLEALYQTGNQDDFWQLFETELLQQRVKFPLLEFVAQALFSFVPPNEQLALIDRLLSLDYEGGYVIIGKLLQERLILNREEAVERAAACIVQGDKWYVCDIIGERVFGHGLLHGFAEMVGVIRPFLTHPNFWLQRSVGIATHYATKKGLPSDEVNQLFNLLLPLATSKQTDVKKGVGWAFKTIAKFYPELVRPQLQAILADKDVNPWCKNKLKVGLALAEERARQV